MVRIVDLNAAFAKLAKLEGRRPTTSAAEREHAMSRLILYRDGAVFAAKFSGKGAWERHPKGEEIVHIVEGATTLRLITAEGRQSLELTAGALVVVPQNAWHQFEAPNGVLLVTVTPQPTENLEVDVEDPRTVG